MTLHYARPLFGIGIHQFYEVWDHGFTQCVSGWAPSDTVQWAVNDTQLTENFLHSAPKEICRKHSIIILNSAKALCNGTQWCHQGGACP